MRVQVRALLWSLCCAAAAAALETPVPAAAGLKLPPFPQLRGPSYEYRCDTQRGGCVRTPRQPAAGGGDRHKNKSASAWDEFAWSQRACQVRCGRAGSLWPLPTGRVSLGARLVVVAAADGALLLPSSCASASSPRLVRLLRQAHRGLQRRLQAEEVASRAQYARSGHVRALRLPRALASREVEPRAAASTARLDVEVCVQGDSLALDWYTDESYVLDGLHEEQAAEGGRQVFKARIVAPTFFGARHALETLSQLIAHTGPPPDGSSDGSLVVPDRFSVTDAPAYPHRGLLLDTSRNYYSPAYIRATINAMAQNKLNVLHWHITDSQSFPYESSSLPQMSAYGAFSPRQTYPSRTVRELSRFALSRGVRLLPELDAPAHVAAGWGWGRAAGLGELVVCAAQQPWIRYCVEPPCGQLNPANPNVYRVLAALFQDMLEDFYDAPAPGSPAPYFHMGGDEVHLGCWNSSREVVDYMSRALGRPKRRKEDFIALWGHFQARATQALDRAQQALSQPSESATDAPLPDVDAEVEGDGHGNSVRRRRRREDPDATTLSSALLDAPDGYPGNDDDPLEDRAVQGDGGGVPVILWTSELTAANVVEKYLDKDRYVIQLWLRAGDPLARDLVSKGYRVIVSTKDAWYLDHGFGNWKGNSTSGYGYHPWQVAYDNDPLAGLEGLPGATRQVLGGEAAMWGEQADQSGASTKTWPRSAAVAERLWSGSAAGTWTAARIRFVRHRDRMARLGTPSEAVQPEWCTQHEGQCY